MKHYLEKYSTVWICIALTLATTAVFYEVCTYDFINYDDNRDIYENPSIKNGLNWESIKWAFITDYAAIWHPLTWLSHILAWQIFGSNAGGHHLFNLILHIANTLLVFIVLKKMTNAVWQSAFVAALFAIHPLHVQSVAWVTERKDVLSTFFMMLTIWAYWGYVNKPKCARYILVVIFFALGLMSKAMLVTLPFVLLLLDYWPLERLWVSRQSKDKIKTRSLRYLLIEKIPLFAMIAPICIMTYLFQKKGGTMAPGENITFIFRLANSFISYFEYIIKMIWPANLAFFYQHPARTISMKYAALTAIILLAVTILVFRFAKKHRYLFTGWFWYLGTLVPVIGFVQVGNQGMADRYTYITLTGLFIIIAWGMPELLGKLPYRKFILSTSALAILLLLSVSAYFEQKYWQNMETLCIQALKVTKNNSMAHYYYMKILLDKGEASQAAVHLNETMRLGLDSSYAPYYLGRIQLLKGNLEQAVINFQNVLQIKQDWPEPMNDLAWLLAVSNNNTIRNPQKAVSLAERACELTYYQNSENLDTLAAAYAAIGDFTKAIETAKQAVIFCQSAKLKAQISYRIRLYEHRKPYIE